MLTRALLSTFSFLLITTVSCNRNKVVECDDICKAHELTGKGDKAAAIKILENAKFESDGAAQFQLALLYEDSNTPNIKSLTHYKRSADLGFPTGMAYYGAMILKGMGLEKNPDLALEYFTKVLNSEKSTEQDKQLVRQQIQDYKKEKIDQFKSHGIITEFKADLEASGKKFLNSSFSRATVDTLDENIFKAIMKAVKGIQNQNDSDIMGLMYNIKEEAILFFKESKLRTSFSKMNDAELGELVATKKCFTTNNPEQDCYHLRLFKDK